MEIKRIPIAKVFQWDKNPRTIKKESLERLKRQIAELGVYKPLIAAEENGKYIVLGGNMRLQALQELKATEVDISIVKAKTEAMKIKYALSDNDRAGETDAIKLAELIGSHKEEINFEEFKIDFGKAIDLNDVIGYVAANPAGSSKARYQNIGMDTEWKTKEELKSKTKEYQKSFDKIRQVFCSFSGGRDSTLALYFMKKVYLPKIPLTAVFVDPGVEFPGMSTHAYKTATALGCEFEIVKPKVDFWLGTLKWGWPGMLGSWCRPRLIYQPYDDFIKEQLQNFKEEEVLLIDGSRGDQSVPHSKKTKNSKYEKFPKIETFHPIYDLKKEEMEKIFKEAKLPLWEGYSMGFRRTACWCCPSQSPRQAYALQKNYPGLADFIRSWEKVLKQNIKHFVGGKLDLIHHGEAKSFDELVKAGKRLSAKEKATRC